MRKDKETGSDKMLNAKIAAFALQYYFDETNKKNETIAVTALAMYLKSHEHQSYAKILAQAALAIYLQNEPDTILQTMKSYKTVIPNNSAWSNKILLMSQLPLRK